MVLYACAMYVTGHSHDNQDRQGRPLTQSLTVELRHSLIPDRLASAVIEAEIQLAHSHLVR